MLYGPLLLQNFGASALRSGRHVAAPLFLALAAALILFAAPGRAHAAPPSALFVYGKSEARLQTIVQNVVERVLRDAGWPLVPPFSDNEAAIVRGCVAKDAPWPCIENMATKKGIERIVAVRVDLEKSSDGTSQVIVTGRLVYAGSASFLEQQRFCGACSDEDLASYSEDVAKLLMDERAIQTGTTKVGVSSVPMGAEVHIDGELKGKTNSIFATAPGKHTVELRARGYKTEKRDFTAIDGKTVVVATVTMQAGEGGGEVGGEVAVGGEGPQGSGGGSIGDEGSGDVFRKWGPKAMVGVGGALVITGVVLLILDEPEVTKKGPNVPKTHRETTLGGAVSLVSGAALAGAGGYLWWKYSKSKTAPTVSTSSNGVVVGVAGAF